MKSCDDSDSLFRRDLHHALINLYDPSALRKSSLAAQLHLPPTADLPSVLRRLLTEAIQDLKPAGKVSAESSATRIHQVLSYRFVEQISQKEVALDLALSIRQLRRLEGQAICVLADVLRARHPNGATPPGAAAAESANVPAPASTPPNEASQAAAGALQELEWLQKTSPPERIAVDQLVKGTLQTIQPLLAALAVEAVVEAGMELAATVPASLPPVTAGLTALRQALLTILTAAARAVAGGQITIRIDVQHYTVLIDTRAGHPAAGKNGTGKGRATKATVSKDTDGQKDTDGKDEADKDGTGLEDMLRLADQLVEISGGSLERLPLEPGEAAAMRVRLPVTEQAPVLVIDDNEDILHLFERYLSGSRFRFVGANDPDQVLPLVEATRPRAVLLDVMLPIIDGWELLGRLRIHPALAGVPIIICTILPQEQLALALGAAELLRKPVSRETILATLERLLDTPGPGSP